MPTFDLSNDHKLAFTLQQTAEAANISLGMARKLVREGKLDAVRIGRCVRIPRRAVLNLCGMQPEEAQ